MLSLWELEPGSIFLLDSRLKQLDQIGNMVSIHEQIKLPYSIGIVFQGGQNRLCSFQILGQNWRRVQSPNTYLKLSRCGSHL